MTRLAKRRLVWPEGFEAAVTLTFDGGYAETFDSVLPLLEQYNRTATWFLVTSSVGGMLEGRAVAPWSAWSDALKKGMELGSHTVTHPALYPHLLARLRSVVGRLLTVCRSPRALVRLLERREDLSRGGKPKLVDRKILVEEALSAARQIARYTGAEITSFAYPHGRSDRRCGTMLQDRGFFSARTTDDGVNAAHDCLYRLRTKVVTRKTTAATLNSWAKEALDRGGWLIETYHLVSDENRSGYEWWISAETFGRHLNSLRERRLWVATQAQVTRWLLSHE